MWDDFFFVGLPYIALILFFGGTIYRAFSGFKGAYRGWDWTVRGDFYWSTRSTGFFGRTSLGPGVLCLHWGIIILFIAHLAGFIGGVFNLTSFVDFFRWLGRIGGIITIYGVTWCLIRRITNKQVRTLSTAEDYIVLVLLLVISGLGLYQEVVALVFGVSYSVGPWLASILKLQPNVELIKAVPLVNRLHVILALLFFAYFPFTKLVHVISYPFGYITRPYISVRSYKALKR